MLVQCRELRIASVPPLMAKNRIYLFLNKYLLAFKLLMNSGVSRCLHGGGHEGLFICQEIQTMINAGFIDFLFTGAVIVPAMLIFDGHVGEAILLLIPMLIAACLFSMYHQQLSADESPARADAAASDREPHQA